MTNYVIQHKHNGVFTGFVQAPRFSWKMARSLGKKFDTKEAAETFIDEHPALHQCEVEESK